MKLYFPRRINLTRICFLNDGTIYIFQDIMAPESFMKEERKKERET